MTQRLFDVQTEENGVAQLAKILKDFRPQVWVLDDVIQLGVIIGEKSRRSVIITLKPADLRQDALQRRHVLKDSTLEQILDDF